MNRDAGPAFLERPVLPFAHLVEDGVGDPTDEIQRDLGAVELS
jgi:hypothetical protein